MKDDDIKILHNIAICHFYTSECTQPTQLLSELKVHFSLTFLRNRLEKTRAKLE